MRLAQTDASTWPVEKRRGPIEVGPEEYKMEKGTGKAMKSQGQEVSKRSERLRRMKIPKQGVCCPFCGSKERHTVVPWSCSMPTREVCERCGKDFVLGGDEILYFA